MRRQETTYMAMGGQEYALLPVTAMELVRAGAETGALLAGDAPERPGDRELIFSAAIVAAGAHLDGRRAFSGPEEVLETLTAEEILSAAGEYGYDGSGSEKEETTAEAAETANLPDKTTPAPEGPEQPWTEQSADTSRLTPEAASDPERAEWQDGRYDTGLQGERWPASARDGFSEDREGSPYRPVTVDTTIPVETVRREDRRGELPAEELSGFFERDSRRYDGTIAVL